MLLLARTAAAIHQPDVAKREIEDKFDEEFAAIEGFMSDDDADEEVDEEGDEDAYF